MKLKCKKKVNYKGKYSNDISGQIKLCLQEARNAGSWSLHHNAWMCACVNMCMCACLPSGSVCAAQFFLRLVNRLPSLRTRIRYARSPWGICGSEICYEAGFVAVVWFNCPLPFSSVILPFVYIPIIVRSAVRNWISFSNHYSNVEDINIKYPFHFQWWISNISIKFCVCAFLISLLCDNLDVCLYYFKLPAFIVYPFSMINIFLFSSPYRLISYSNTYVIGISLSGMITLLVCSFYAFLLCLWDILISNSVKTWFIYNNCFRTSYSKEDKTCSVIVSCTVATRITNGYAGGR